MMMPSKSIVIAAMILSTSFISSATEPNSTTDANSCPAGQQCHYSKSCIYSALGIGGVTLYFALTIIGWGLGAMRFGPLGPIAVRQSKIGLVAIVALQSAGAAGIDLGSAVSSAVFATCPCNCATGK